MTLRSTVGVLKWAMNTKYNFNLKILSFGTYHLSPLQQRKKRFLNRQNSRSIKALSNFAHQWRPLGKSDVIRASPKNIIFSVLTASKQSSDTIKHTQSSQSSCNVVFVRNYICTELQDPLKMAQSLRCFKVGRLQPHKKKCCDVIEKFPAIVQGVATVAFDSVDIFVICTKFAIEVLSRYRDKSAFLWLHGPFKDLLSGLRYSSTTSFRERKVVQNT